MEGARARAAGPAYCSGSVYVARGFLVTCACGDGDGIVRARAERTAAVRRVHADRHRAGAAADARPFGSGERRRPYLRRYSVSGAVARALLRSLRDMCKTACGDALALRIELVWCAV